MGARQGKKKRNHSNLFFMDDVDRLFECFKCGVSPPQSALRERKRCKVEKPNKANPTKGEGSVFAGFLSPVSARQRKQSPPNAQVCMEQLATKEVKAIKLTRGKQISPVVFYGSPHGVPAKRPIRLLQLLREIQYDLREENKSSSGRDTWVTFPKQDQAINFAKQDPRARLFSYQDHVNGKRRFLVSTYKEFWRRYKNMDARFRHHYEVIQEGLPCHLYFDLEFNKNVNTDRNGDEMVDLLISVVFDAFYDKYSMHGEEDWVVELDSSTEEKFSRHLIIHVPKAAFKDNSHAGAFVTEICSRIYSARNSDQRLQKLFISKDSSYTESPSHIFVDTAVYSRNRCFRLALSSKAGKSSFLLPTKRFKCKNLCEEDMFMDSLICKIDDHCQKLLICKMDLDCMKTLCFDSEINCKHRQHLRPPDLSLQPATNDLPTTYFVGKSPFPALDVFVESIASIGDILGTIRSWYWFSEYGLMVYNMLRNRYCERIGRQHKSNHVMYIVDLKRFVYYQKCYDPDCKGYRSPFRSIPSDVVPDNGVEYQLDEKEEWWVEAIKVADEIEHGRQMEKNSGKLVDGEEEGEQEEDYEWWMAVEQTASQIEIWKKVT